MIRPYTYLCISGIGVEYVGEEFAGTGYACNYKSMNIETIYNEEVRQVGRLIIQSGIDW